MSSAQSVCARTTGAQKHRNTMYGKAHRGRTNARWHKRTTAHTLLVWAVRAPVRTPCSMKGER